MSIGVGLGKRRSFLLASAGFAGSLCPFAASAEEVLDADAKGGLLEEITVVATRSPQEAFRVPQMVSVIGKREIDDRLASNISEIFQGVPGVQFGGGPRRTGEVPTIRGLSGAAVLVLFDGARQSFLSGHDGRFFIDSDLLSAVEVVKGPGSALYGSPDTFYVDAGVRIYEIDLRLGSRAEIAGPLRKVPDPSLELRAFEKVDLYAVWEPSDGPLRGLRVDLALDNAGDENFDRIAPGATTPGRNFQAAVRYAHAF